MRTWYEKAGCGKNCAKCATSDLRSIQNWVYSAGWSTLVSVFCPVESNRGLLKWKVMTTGNSHKMWQIWYLKKLIFKVFLMGIVQLCSPNSISDIWLKSFLLGWKWGVLKITCPRCKEFLMAHVNFLVVAHMNFLAVAYKNELQELWKLLCTPLE